MKRKQKIIVSITGIVIILLALVGLTYGYYLTRIKGNTKDKSLSVTTERLELVYGDGNAEIINGNGALLPTEETNDKTVIGTKTFTVTNNGNDSSYVVIIDNVNVTKASDNTPTTFKSNDFRYNLSCKVKDKDGNILNDKKCNKVENLSVFPIEGGILLGNEIDEGNVHEYELSLWYIDTGKNQNDDMGKKLHARINIADINQLDNPFKTGDDAVDSKNLAYNIFENSKSKKNGTILVNNPLTKPAEETTLFAYKTNDAIISSDETSIAITTTYQKRYWTYGTEYEVDPETGLFSLKNPKTCLYNDSDFTNNTEIECDKTLSEMVTEGQKVYFISNSNAISTSKPTLKASTDLEHIYLLTSAPESASSTIVIKLKEMSPKPYGTEKELAVTNDDYGISYYFRGDVEDNYVTFSNKCWRIVRIDGNGNIKLILEDQDEVCSSSMNGNYAIPTITDGTTYIGNFGYTEHLSNTLIASDGTENSSTRYLIDYLHGKTNSNASMATAFKNFQNTFTETELSKLESGNWCFADKAYDEENNLLDSMQIIDNKIKGNSFIYDSYKRLVGYNGYQPTLNCNGTIMNDWEDNETNPTLMYVSAITADEIVYAGGKYGEANQSYYLINNYENLNIKYFWSLSPFDFDGNFERALMVGAIGDLNDEYMGTEDSNCAFRPAITLSSSAVITEGEGTIESPYVVG